MENKELVKEEVKHTELPWKACNNGDCVCGMIWSLPADMLVAETISNCRRHEGSNFGDGLSSSSEQFKANTKFIVKAVNSHYELLKALKWAMQNLNNYDKPSEEDMKSYDEAVQAIAKAEQQ